MSWTLVREKISSSRWAFRDGNDAVFPALTLFINKFSFSLNAFSFSKSQQMSDSGLALKCLRN